MRMAGRIAVDRVSRNALMAGMSPLSIAAYTDDPY